MARIGTNTKVTLHLDGGDAGLTFREPSNEELNNYYCKILDLKGKDRVSDLLQARKEFFDKLLIEVNDIEDKDGNPLDVEGCKKHLRTALKNTLIVRMFDEVPDFDIKN